MSELVAIEELDMLDGPDLRAVLEQVSREELLAALGGLPPGLRQRLLSKLPARRGRQIEDAALAHGPVPFEKAQAAQQALIEALCRMSRAGQVAFDVPDDMVA